MKASGLRAEAFDISLTATNTAGTRRNAHAGSSWESDGKDYCDFLRAVVDGEDL